MKKCSVALSKWTAFLCICMLFLVGFDTKANESEQVNVNENSIQNIVKEETNVPEADDIIEDAELSGEKVEEDTNVLGEEVNEIEESWGVTRAPAEYISKYNIIKLSGWSSPDKKNIETFEESGQNINGSYTLTAQNTYLNTTELAFTVRQAGTLGSVSITSPECEIVKGDRHSNVVGGDGGVTEFMQDFTIKNISPDATSLKIEFVVNTRYMGGNLKILYRELIIPILNNRMEAPTVPEIVYDVNYPDSYILTGMDNTMEYANVDSKSGLIGEWKPCTGENIILNPSWTVMKYRIRYKATGEMEPSNYKELILPIKRGAPTITLNPKEEILVGLTTEMEYCIGNGTYAPVTEEFSRGNVSSIVDSIVESSSEVKIRYKASEKPRSLDLTKRVALGPVIESGQL